MTAESPLTSVDFMSDGGTLAVGSTRGLLTKMTTLMLITWSVEYDCCKWQPIDHIFNHVCDVTGFF